MGTLSTNNHAGVPKGSLLAPTIFLIVEKEEQLETWELISKMNLRIIVMHLTISNWLKIVKTEMVKVLDQANNEKSS